jgi:long-chain acyl-CoA synthetase
VANPISIDEASIGAIFSPVLSPGNDIDLEEIEAHYRRSPFIKEVCVLRRFAAGEAAASRLHALVVPDLEVFRQRKIINIGELIRFEVEGLSISLPPDRRVLEFDITMRPLPRTPAGDLNRTDIARRYEEPPLEVAPEPVDDHTARIIELVKQAAGPGVAVHADSNLEFDLWFDSLQRIELILSLEQRFGVRLREDVALRAYLVRDLAEAFRGATQGAGRHPFPWASMLEQVNPGPELRNVLAPRTFAAVVIFMMGRVLVRLLVRPTTSGLENLPRRGPYIISPNHQTYIDPFVLMGVLPFGVLRQLFFVGAAEYFQTRVTAWLARRMNIVPVDPDTNLIPAMQAGAFGLEHGKILVLFPEGERSIDGGVKKFKRGAAILSQQRDVPIVPVAIHGVFEIWPRNRPFDWRRLVPWSGHRVHLVFGAPIDPPGAGVSYADHTEVVRSAVEGMWTGVDADLRSGQA